MGYGYLTGVEPVELDLAVGTERRTDRTAPRLETLK